MEGYSILHFQKVKTEQLNNVTPQTKRFRRLYSPPVISSPENKPPKKWVELI